MISRQHMQGSGSPLPIALIGQAIRKLSRHELEAITERLIERLDELDGDCDIEDDDPAGTDLDLGEDDGAHGRVLQLAAPTYADDGHNQTIIVKNSVHGFHTKVYLNDYPMS